MTTPSDFQAGERQAQATRARLPRFREVLMEHVRTTGLLLRVPMIVAALAGVLFTVFVAIQVLVGEMEGNVHAEPSVVPGMLAALLAIAIWVREERFGPGFLWTLPVDRSRHVLIKVLAGWLWLMAGAMLYAICQLVLAVVTGGEVLPVETLHLLDRSASRPVQVDPAILRTVQWSPGPLIWAVPFGAATATYLIVSALMLGIRHPLRWLIGAVVAVPVVSAFSHVTGRLLGATWLADAPARAATSLVTGRYGLEALLTLRTWSLDGRAVLTTGERIQVWSAVPDLSDWGVAVLLWTGAGLLALWLAASRHRERRRL